VVCHIFLIAHKWQDGAEMYQQNFAPNPLPRTLANSARHFSITQRHEIAGLAQKA
jgi:hypothetical protein